MHITTATAPGSPDAPNEDFALTTPNLIVVCDGATVRTETGCSHGADWYARTLGAAIAYHSARVIPLRFVLEKAVVDVAVRHEDSCDLEHPGTPSAGVGIVEMLRDRIRWLVLGDVSVVLDTADGITAISDQRISAAAAAERAEVDRYPIGSEQKAVALVAMKHAELADRGRDYWVAAADPLAAHHAIIGDLPASEVRRFAVLTDGAARWVDLYRAGDWDAALRVLGHAGPQWFIDHLVRGIEAHDPLGIRYARNKRSDDATAVYVELATPWQGDDLEVPEHAAAEARAELHSRTSNPHLYGDGILIKGR